MQKVIYKIEFWIIIFFLIRLTGITNPPLETGHNWRQVTGLMVARNFLETDACIAYPRIDNNNGETGITGMEFPIMSYLHFMLAKVFGYTHWYGRIINLIVSSVGLFFFYKIIKRFFNHRIAFASALCLIGSIWFAFSRKMMPDTFCISLMFIGLYFGIQYLDKRGIKHLLLYILFASAAVLSKIPAGMYFVIILLLIITFKTDSKQKIYLGISSIIPLFLTFYWYFIWNPSLSEKYGTWYNTGKSLSTGFHEIATHIGMTLKNFHFFSFYSYLFFVLFITGLVIIFYKRNIRLIAAFGALLLIFLIYIFKSGYYFYHHNYYIIPFVPVMAMITGYTISLIKKKWLFTGVLIIGIGESIANQQHDFFIKPSKMYKMKLEAIADSVSNKYDLIVINGNGNPQQLYLSNRKGWVCYNAQVTDSAFINKIAKNGCRFIFINKHDFNGQVNKNIIFTNDDYTVCKIDVIGK